MTQKPKWKRLSRLKLGIKGSLRGASSQKYYALHNMTNYNLVVHARKYLEQNLWTKFDRQKPISDKQAQQVVMALNRVMYENCTNYPYIIPFLRMRQFPGDSSSRNVWVMKTVEFIELPKIPTSKGTVYTPIKTVLDYRGHRGKVGFSSHAIDRMVERLQFFEELCQRDTSMPLRLWSRTIREAKLSWAEGVKLAVDPIGDPFGYFCLEWLEAESLWLATSFLLPHMRGTPLTAMTIDQMAESLKKGLGSVE